MPQKGRDFLIIDSLVNQFGDQQDAEAWINFCAKRDDAQAEPAGVPLSEFWEKDDGVRMDGLIRVERFVISQGTRSGQIWGAWYDIKQLVKAALKYSGAPAEQRATCAPANVEAPQLPTRGEFSELCEELTVSPFQRDKLWSWLCQRPRTAPAAHPASGDACPDCHGHGATVGQSDNLDVEKCLSCNGTGKLS